MKLRLLILTILIIQFCGVSSYVFSQASPANWMYPDGNYQATKNVLQKSWQQDIPLFTTKWSTPYISGDVKPLIGNVVNNPILPNFPYSPNEIVAVMGEKIVIISGTGSLIKNSRLPIENVDGLNAINGISCLIDTTATSLNNFTSNQVVLGMSTSEVFNPQSKDSTAYSYIFGYNGTKDTIMPLKRFAINLKPYSPNIFASVNPIFGRKVDGKLMVYASVNMSKAKVLNPNLSDPQYFRGIAQFYDVNNVSSFPLPDVSDDINYRAHVGGEVIGGQPSLYDLGGNQIGLTFPYLPTTKDIDINYEGLFISSLLGSDYLDTYADIGELVSLTLDNATTKPTFITNEINSTDGKRPLVRPYYVDITNNINDERGFILVTEGYSGTDSSSGISKLHLFSKDGTRLTAEDLETPINPYIKGGLNHYWSVAVGDVDGNESNTWDIFYPNNRGNEIIVTQSTRDFVYPGSTLSILRYRTTADIPKPSQNGEYLAELDTICTQRIDGWVAAVNDLDGKDDNKAEIVLVNGSKLFVIRMRDYSNVDFRLGRPFDTVLVREFYNQTISNVAIADMEGDGKNDLIVTTYDSTFVIGSTISNTLHVITPKDSSQYYREYCLGDTVELKWVNSIYSQTNVNLRFIKYLSGFPIPDTSKTIIRSMIPNNKDTVIYKLVVDTLLAGKEGMLVVEGYQNPLNLFDTTTVLKFNKPSYQLKNDIDSVFYIGENIKIDGNLFCADSVLFEFKADSTTWLPLGYFIPDNAGELKIDTIMPCILNRFPCDSSQLSDLLYLRLIAFKSIFKDTINIQPTNLKPARFPVEMDTVKTASPSKVFTWDPLALKPEYACSNLSISFSPDFKNFYEIVSVPVADAYYKWNVPIDIPDSILVRFCCENSCVRTDTIMAGMKPRYLDIIAPNPFNPNKEQLEIIYKVPKEMKINIKIVDQNNRIVSVIVNGADRLPNIAYTDNWDGRLIDKSLAANGLYYIVLEFDSGAREIYPLFIRK